MDITALVDRGILGLGRIGNGPCGHTAVVFLLHPHLRNFLCILFCFVFVSHKLPMKLSESKEWERGDRSLDPELGVLVAGTFSDSARGIAILQTAAPLYVSSAGSGASHGSL